jgi:hypothetical protein
MSPAQRQVRSALNRVAAATPSGTLLSTKETAVLKAVRALGAVSNGLVKVADALSKEPEALDQALREAQQPTPQNSANQ